MNKKQYCLSKPTIAYYSGCGGIEIKGIEGDYIYCISNAWCNSNTYGYHKLKINYTLEDAYIVVHGYRIKLSECLRADL